MPLKQFCCKKCGECAPKALLEHGQFEKRMDWLRHHQKHVHGAVGDCPEHEERESAEQELAENMGIGELSFKDRSAVIQERMQQPHTPEYQRFLENCLTMGLVGAMNALLNYEMHEEREAQAEQHIEPYPPFNVDRGSKT